MPNVPISGLPLTTSVCATALVPIVQNGVTCSTYACLLGSGGGGGVTQITAGSGVTISPACGLGNVTICASGGGGVMAAGSGTCSIQGSGCSNSAYGDFSFVGGGLCNSANCGSFVGGGCNNIVTSAFSFLGGGVCNNICSNCSVVVGGNCNNILSGNVSFIGGGNLNTINSGNSSILGGIGHTIDGNYSSISGGSCSTISGGYGFIGSGRFNKICNSTTSSSILGGCCNTAACNFTGVFGCNLCNTQPCTFMANNFVVGNFVGCNGCMIALDVNGKMCLQNSNSPMTFGSGTCSILGNACCCNVSCGNFSFIGGGKCNTSSGTYSFVGGGLCNTASSATGYTSVVGGCCALACGDFSFIAGGYRNCAICNYTGVFGCDLCNAQPCTFMANNFVIGDFVGCNGCTLALNANGKMCLTSVGGGSVMVAGIGVCSIKGNGNFNNACGDCSFVGGGCCNRACCEYSSVVGGASNVACSSHAVVVGGFNNINGSFYGSFVGGFSNTASGCYAGILGGKSNTVSGTYSFVGGGLSNTAFCNFTGVFGCNLCNTQPCTFMANNFVVGDFVGCGGCTLALDANGKMCVTSGGSSPMVIGSGTCSIVGNGCGNTSSGNFSFVGGGSGNSASSSYNVVVGGLCNSNCTTCGFGFIGGGSFNKIGTCGGQCHNVIVGGTCNISNGNFYGGIFTGFNNCNTYTCAAFSAGEAFFAVTMGGCCNYNTSCFGFIGNGFNNCFQNSFGYNSYGSIINGFCNKICMACHGVILSGNNNTLTGNCSAVLNGNNNNIGSGTVISGNNNIDCGCHFIMGSFNLTCGGKGTISGCCNFTNGCVIDSFISGCCNCLCTNSACYGCTISFPFVQGNCNFITNALPTYENIGNAVIFGSCNLICSDCTGASTNNVMVFGCNLIGQNQNTAYFNNLCVCGTLSKVSGSFKIPHPDPSKAECGKFLKHSFVESPTAGDNIYRFNVTTSNCSASIDLPDYYNLLNGNSHIHVSPDSHFGVAYGKINQENTKVNICSNSDGDYFVLLVGTRKDKLALDSWNGAEVEANEKKQ